jgi:hypothetical protein
MSSVESYSDVESNTDGGGDWLAAESSASLFVIFSRVRTFSEPLNTDICKNIKGEYRLEVIDEHAQMCSLRWKDTPAQCTFTHAAVPATTLVPQLCKTQRC